MTAQLALSFPPSDPYRAEDLLPNPAQEAARHWLARTALWPLGRLVLWGGAGVGKTHLLHLWAKTQGATVLTAPPAAGDWPGGAVALDEYDRLSPPQERGLFHLLNAAQQAGVPVLLAGRAPPGRLPPGCLPDLASRLRATTAVEVAPPPDPVLEALLARMLAARQLRLPAGLAGWMLARLPRSPAALQEAVRRLELGVQQTGRTLTRPLAASLLGLTDHVPTPDRSPPV